MSETLLPTSIVPGLVTVKGKDGKTQNVYPIDAVDLIKSGEYELVDNGCVEAARLNINPIRSNRFSGDPANVVAEVTGIAGMVIEAKDAETAEQLREQSNSPDAKPKETQDPQAQAAEREDKSAKDGAAKGQNTGQTPPPAPAPAPAKPK